MRIPAFLNPYKLYGLQKSLLTAIQLRTWLSTLVKQAFDIFASAAALLMLAPFFGLIALAIKRDSPGPVFYRGERMGRGGKIFKILKFRTMFERPESYQGPRVTAHDDTRITPLGQWLRDTKLNELPQFWNVLKGEMSMVGPRPEDPSIAKTWPLDVWKEVLSVRPGVTSPASIQYRNEESLLSTGSVMSQYVQEIGPDKIRLDQLYVRHRSFLLDLDVILWTALIMLPKIGSAPIPERLLFVGPIYRLMYRYLRWFSIDILVTFFAMGFTGFIFRLSGPLDVGWPLTMLLFLGFALIFSLAGALFGVQRVAWSKANFTDIYDLLPPWLFASTIVIWVNWRMAFYPSAMLILASILALAGFIFVRYRNRLFIELYFWISHHLQTTAATRERLLIVGSGRTAEQMAWLLDHPVYASKLRVVGFVDDALPTQGMRIYGAKILGQLKDIPALVQKHDVGIMILADHRLGSREYQSIAATCQQIPVKMVVAPDIFGSLKYLFDRAASTSNIDLESVDLCDYCCSNCLINQVPSENKMEEYQHPTSI
jgi:lipopolysaccharide/colanic/teichoic acid biosynthesis glycosyltransferase